MDDPRKALGKRVSRARRRAGYRSQGAFAEAIGISESSVANTERGSSSVGMSVLTAIEDALQWPEGGIARYLETGSAADLEALTPQRKPPPEVRPLTLVEQRLMQVYILLRQMGLAEDEAKALAFQVGRQLELDEAVFVAIERQPVPVD